MSDFRGLLSLQTDALRKALRAQQEMRCRDLLGKAEAEAKALVQHSAGQLRERVREAIGEERRRREAALQQARHRIETTASRELQKFYDRLLADAWPQLTAELGRRWSRTASRKGWCQMLIREAEYTLGRNPWTIEHPATWSGQDTKWLTAILRGYDVPEPSCRTDSAITAGLRIHHGGACLDGTIEGLLARRTGVEAKLLAAWEHESAKLSEPRRD